MVSSHFEAPSPVGAHGPCVVKNENEATGAGHAYDFGFNNPQFSDRILHVVPERCSPADAAGDRSQQEIRPLLSLHVNSLTLAANSEVFR